MPVLSGLTVNDVNSNSLAPVAAFHSPGLGGAGAGGASGGCSAGPGGAGGVVGGVGIGGVSGGVAGAHPAKIMLTTITTVNKGMINFFIITSSLKGGHRGWFNP